jgi:hypothetical protein
MITTVLKAITYFAVALKWIKNDGLVQIEQA